ncbi:glycosyltransferase family 4 protein [Glaciihabitans sp. dw_435]|uniref:glycosyltransferase family 4 protein n=1 Tax=Glaciihabitans sp. dw_435 TaxID=2720081 RepID=UPI001BD2E140|nr:glycosyltransferase family 4 protein [Glaciihabitans sp. dw_435]
MRELTKIAFGTPAAEHNYAELLGANYGVSSVRVQSRIFLGLPAASQTTVARENNQACFVGSFEDRKGIRELLDAWPEVLLAIPNAKLEILGQGPLEGLVHTAARKMASVETSLHPSRETIERTLSLSHVLILPSVRTATWREQIGLPIVEGLAEGCEVITTDETGLANWLQLNDHLVLTKPTRAQLAAAIVMGLSSTRTAPEAKSLLPAIDGRHAADQWLTREPPDSSILRG